MLKKIPLLILVVFAMGVSPTHSLARTVYTCTDQEGRIIYTDSPAQLASCQPMTFEWADATQGTSRDSLSHHGATSEDAGVSGQPELIHHVASVVPDSWSPPVGTGSEDLPPSEETNPVPPEFPPGFEDLLEKWILPTEFFPEGYFPPDFSLE